MSTTRSRDREGAGQQPAREEAGQPPRAKDEQDERLRSFAGYQLDPRMGKALFWQKLL